MTTPTFAEFYLATHGRRPLAWQERLAEQVVTSGWPEEIAVETGLGKTACIDIAVWSLAVEADAPPAERRLPTRLWYVVNRRLLVNEAFRWATTLSEMLQVAAGTGTRPTADIGQALLAAGVPDPSSAAPVLVSIASALAKRCPVTHKRGPLFVSELRGGISQFELPPDPAHPAVVCSTVPMFGSRLLFRGYGSSRSVRPVQTALTAIDSLVLLDEAHLSEPLRTLVAQLSEADTPEVPLLSERRSHPTLVALTATGRSPRPFTLTPEERSDGGLVQTRLNAPKPTQLVSTTKSALARDLAANAVAALTGRSLPAAAVVFVNAPGTAMQVAHAVTTECRRARLDASVRVLTGLVRGADSIKAVSALMGQVRSGRDRSSLDRHVVVVATQTLEVGADLDFDVLVTETCGVRSMAQRFGRLNRLGDPACDPLAVVLHPTDASSDGLYGEEPHQLWTRLSATFNELGGHLDLAPAHIAQVLGEPGDVPPRSPELLPNHLDEWAKTTSDIPGEAPVDLFVSGISDRVERRCVVLWRSNGALAHPVSGSAAAHPDGNGVDGTDATVELFPRPASDETVEVALHQVAAFFGARRMNEMWRLTSDGTSVERAPVDGLRSGDTVVIPAHLGGYGTSLDRLGWDPDNRDEVSDLSVAIRRGSLLVDRSTIANLLRSTGSDTSAGTDAAELVERAGALCEHALDEDDSTRTDPAEVTDLIVALADLVPADDPSDIELPELRVSFTGSGWWVSPAVTGGTSWAGVDADLLDELSNIGSFDELDVHLQTVGELAGRIGAAVGLPPDLVSACRNAGRLHDLGKADPRFQRWLQPTDAAAGTGVSGDGGADRVQLAAKSNRPRSSWRRDRVRAGWPQGGRHEALSVKMMQHPELRRLIEAEGLLEPDAELVEHLVATHHGFGRPGLFGVDDVTATSFRFDPSLAGIVSSDTSGAARGPIECDGDLSDHDVVQPGRFARLNRRYGRRGLALLEAVVRQADWAASSMTNSGQPDKEQQ